MKRWVLTGIAFVLMFFVTAIVHAEVTLRATIDRNELTPGEDVTISVSVEGNLNVSDPVAPTVDGLQIIKSGRTSQIQVINGQMSISAEFLFTVVPDKEGVFNIPPFQVFHGGQTFKSNPLTLKVTESVAQQPVKPNQMNPYGYQGQPQNQTSPQFWIDTPVSQPDPYVSQQILYHFKLYTRENITQASPLLPEFNDFFTEVVVEDKRGTEVINGRSYATWEKVLALVPLKPGQFTIPPAEIEIVYEVIENGRTLNRWDPFFNNSLFNAGFRQTKRTRLKSKPVSITVKALPEPVPQNFTGLVGDFGLQSSLSDQNVKVGDSATFEVTLSGSGNINDARLPEFAFDGFKIYVDKPKSEIIKSEMGISGQKKFKIALVPQKEGEFNFPPLRVSFFNPTESRYVDLETVIPNIAVAPADGDQGTSAVIAGDGGAQEILYEDIAPIFPDARQVLGRHNLRMPSAVFYSIAFGMPMSFLVLMAGRLIRAPKSSKIKSQRRKVFKDLMAVLEHGKSTENQVLQAVRQYMAVVFQVQGQALTAQDMEEIIKRNKLPEKTAERLGRAIESLETVQYGFDKQSALGAVTQELKQVMHEIHKAA